MSTALANDTDKNPLDLNPMDLSGKRLLVTGASAGIGRATAILFSKLGAEVILNGRDQDRLQETANELSGKYHIYAQALDNIDDIPNWLKDIASETGTINGLAHCAGVQITKPIRIVDQEFFDQTMHVNLASCIALAKGLRHKKCRGENMSLVFVSSIAAMIGQPGNSVYSASKGGIITLSKSLAMELMRDKIRVNCVAPALIQTDMATRTKEGMSDEQFQYIIDQHPMGLGAPEDVANTIAFLISDASRWVTGVTQLVDGGYMSR